MLIQMLASLASTCTIPIRGISTEVFFSLETDLLKINGVPSVWRHKNVASGRYSILTKEKKYKEVIQVLQQNCEALVAHHSQHFKMVGSHGKPGLAFKNHPGDKDSDTDMSFQSYCFACSSIYSMDAEDLDLPLLVSGPPTQAWGGTKIPCLSLKRQLQLTQLAT